MKMIEGDQVVGAVTSNVSERVLGLYLERYHEVDPLIRAALRRWPDASAARVCDLIPTREFQETEFYWDFARPAGSVHIMGGFLPSGSRLQAALALHRPKGDPDFSDAERRKHDAFLIPAARALALRQRLGEAQEAGFAAFEALAFGAVVCDADGRVLFANRAAEALAGGSRGLLLGSRHGGVSADLPREASRLAELIRRAGASAEAGAMTLEGAAGEKLFLIVTPLPRRFGGATPRVLITLRAVEPAAAADPAALRSIFGLTPAEARVGSALSAGRGVGEIAADLAVGEETIRTHVKRVLAKAGVSSQRELVALLALIPPVENGRNGVAGARRHSGTG